jgi:xyloglucan-specific endo-beta-1,4-glucanase
MREKYLRFTFGNKFGSALTLSVILVAVVSCTSAAHAQTCVDGQYSTLSQGYYMLQNDEWGLAGDPSGWQEICSGNSSPTINSWSSTWYWSTGTGAIKAYPSIYRGWQDGGSWSSSAGGFPQQISAQGSMPTSVTFDMTGHCCPVKSRIGSTG